MNASRTAQEAPGASVFPLADRVRAELRWGADRARSIGDLAEAMEESRRDIEQALQTLALTEYTPLVAGPRGVYLTHSPTELADYCESLRRRLVSQYLRIRALRRCARRMAAAEQKVEQTTLWEAA